MSVHAAAVVPPVVLTTDKSKRKVPCDAAVAAAVFAAHAPAAVAVASAVASRVDANGHRLAANNLRSYASAPCVAGATLAAALAADNNASGAITSASDAAPRCFGLPMVQ
jgi:hypothetical protein